LVESGSDEWHRQRAQGIGGSDAAIIMKISPWKNVLELWTEKVEGKRREFNGNELMKWGNILEPLIANEYSKNTGREIITDEDKCHYIHPINTFMIGNVDGIIHDKIKGKGILEIKTKNAYTKWEHDWKDGNIPIYYKMQFQHYLAASECDWGSFAILDLGSMEIVTFDVERDDKLINELITEEIKFWDSVINKVKPNIDDSKSTNDFIRSYYKESDDDLGTLNLENNEDATKWGKQLLNAKNMIKSYKKGETEALNHLMDIIGLYEKAIGDNFSVTWKSPKDRSIFNEDIFKKEHPDLHKKYVETKPQTRRFVFKELND